MALKKRVNSKSEVSSRKKTLKVNIKDEVEDDSDVAYRWLSFKVVQLIALGEQMDLKFVRND